MTTKENINQLAKLLNAHPDNLQEKLRDQANLLRDQANALLELSDRLVRGEVLAAAFVGVVECPLELAQFQKDNPDIMAAENADELIKARGIEAQTNNFGLVAVCHGNQGRDLAIGMLQAALQLK